MTFNSYQVRWAHGVDFEKMKLTQITNIWDEADGDIEFMFRHADVREAVFMDTNLGRNDNNTKVEKDPSLWETGDNVVYNNENNTMGQIHLVMNGRNESINSVTMTGVRCLENCFEDSPEDVPLGAPRFWSDPNAWENLPDRIPLGMEDVYIEPGWNMIYDLNETDYVHGYVEVNGKLSFLSGMEY